jgi:hypothetical protein
MIPPGKNYFNEHNHKPVGIQVMTDIMESGKSCRSRDSTVPGEPVLQPRFTIKKKKNLVALDCSSR